MRWENTETPTFAGSAGSDKAPAVAETLTLKDRLGNVLATFTKSVAGVFSTDLLSDALALKADAASLQSAVLTDDFPKVNDTLTVVTGWSSTITLEAGKTYRVTGRIASSSPAVGWQLGFNGGTVTATGLSGDIFACNNDNSLFVGSNLTALTDTYTMSTADPSFAVFDFTIEVNASGTLILQFAQNTTNATATPMLKYSTIQAVDITPS